MTTPAPAVLSRQASAGQRILWMMEHYSSGPGALNVPVVHRLRGSLDESALARALRDLTDRHESLRTTFSWAGHRLSQRISASAELPFECVDVDGLSENDLAEQVRIRQRAAIDLSASPARVILLRRSPQDHVLLFNIHHLVTDAWSNRLISRDLSKLYTAQCTGVPAELPPVACQYRDFLDWQDQHLNRERIAAQQEFWASHLDGARFARLPVAAEAAAERSADVARFDITAESLAALRSAARTHRATLFTVLLAAFYCALFESTSQDDLSVGSLFANRLRSEVQETVGFFVNMLALRAQVADREPFTTVLPRVRTTVAQALQYQDIPFHLLPRLPLASGAGAVHDVVFHMLAVPPQVGAGTQRWGDLKSESLHVLALLNSRFNFELVVIPEEDRLVGLVRYAANLFDASLITQVIESYKKFITTFAAGHDCMTETPTR
jgi:hypothetical protein